VFYDGEKAKQYGDSSIFTKKIKVLCDGEKLAPFKIKEWHFGL
jgi:hypothetical protein